VKSVIHTCPVRIVALLAATLFALMLMGPGLSAQPRDETGLTGDPLVDSILQAPGPDFMERRRPAREESRVWDREPSREPVREPQYDEPAQDEDWDLPAENDRRQRDSEPAPTRRALREPPPPPAQRGTGPLNIIIRDSEPVETDVAAVPPPEERQQQQPETPVAQDPLEQIPQDIEAPEAAYRESAETVGDQPTQDEPDQPDQVAAVGSPAAGRAPAMPVQAPERPTPEPQLRRMIGQMIMVGFPGKTPSDPGVRRVAAQLEAGEIGGVILMSRNIEAPRQVRQLTRHLARAGDDHPTPFIAVDQEGGYVQRLSRVKGFKTHPSAERLGARNDPQGAYSAYRNLALELRDYGFNLNLGPVVDLNLNPSNPVIGRLKRSYGTDPDHVTAFAKAFVYAHNETGVLTAAKHFPGHGSSDTDSHDVLVDISQSWQEAELRPYRKLIEAGAIDMIMTGHLYHPSFSDSPETPASLSPKAVERVLRESLNYDGVVITDDLDMRGVRQNTDFDERITGAVAAGNDILLITNSNGYDPDLPGRVSSAIDAAIARGDLSVERIRASYDRIMALKDELARLQRTATSAGEDRGLAEHTSGG